MFYHVKIKSDLLGQVLQNVKISSQNYLSENLALKLSKLRKLNTEQKKIIHQQVKVKSA